MDTALIGNKFWNSIENFISHLKKSVVTPQNEQTIKIFLTL